MQKGKLLSDGMQDWVNSITKEGKKFILDFTTMYGKEETLIGEMQILTLGRQTEQSQCQAIVFKMIEVEKYGVFQFLRESPMKTIDS